MRHIIFSVMITCWAASSVAQQLHAGISVGFRRINTGLVQLQHVTMEINNPRDEHYLVPALTLSSANSNRWKFKGDVQYQPGGISMRVFDQRFSACLVCPVKKGTLVSYRELMFGGSALFGFIQKRAWDLFMGGGLIWTYRFDVDQSPTNGLTNLSQDALLVLTNASKLPEKSYLNGRLEARLRWRKWALVYQYIFLLDKSMTKTITHKGQSYPLRLDQQIHLIGLHYRWLSF